MRDHQLRLELLTCQAKAILFLLGLLFLLLGLFHYVYCRELRPIVFFGIFNNIQVVSINSIIKYSFPSLSHQISFSMITISLLCRTRTQMIVYNTTWLMLNFVYETLQFIHVAPGTFDPFDLVAACLGFVLVIIIFHYIQRRSKA